MRTKFAILLILTGLAGSILFLPQKMQSQHTCFFNKLWDACYAATERNDSPSEAHHISMHSAGHHSVRGEQMLAQYLIPYGFFWWGSLLLLGLGVWLFYRERKQADCEANWKFK